MPESQHDVAELKPATGDPSLTYGDEIEPEDLEPPPLTPESRRRMKVGIVVIIALGLTAVLPPLINVNRYRRRIATSISISLGRPVHLDSVSLNLLPLPGFTLSNFVVSEDPAFGSEPVIRANTVTATLRIRSLWRGHVEFSKIALDEPSVNLVHRADGQWNIESILLQASRMPVVPTEQTAVPGIQRFPYIEATGARVNLKQGLEKKPISLLDAKFALWLAQPELWRLRLQAHPTRTDTAPADTGLLQVEGTLGKANSLLNVPIDLHGEWSAVPLGAASFLMLGHDSDLRGEMTLLATLKGPVGDSDVISRLQLRRLRRAEFVPTRMLDADINCKAHAERLFHRFTRLRCTWPPEADQTGLGALVVSGDVPDVRHLDTAALTAEFANVPVGGGLDLLHEMSSRVSQALDAGGLLSGKLTCCDNSLPLSLQGSFTIQHSRLALNGIPLRPAADEEILGEVAGNSLSVKPFALNLGGSQPATLSMQADAVGAHMHLSGTILRSRLLALQRALPQLGDGLDKALAEPAKGPEAPIKIDLVSTRAWGAGQTWAPVSHPAQTRKGSRR